MTAPAVIKVGGSVLRGASAYEAVARRLSHEIESGPTWIVVSAGAGITDRLLKLHDGGSGFEEIVQAHERLYAGRLPSAVRADLDIARRESDLGLPERLLIWGERASATILQSRLRGHGHAVPIRELDRGQPPGPDPIAIVPGFYLTDSKGGIHLLPRGGGDISAVVVAACLGASSVRLWKNRGGIWLDGKPVLRIEAEALLAKLTDPIRPIHVDAVRIAAQLGIDLRLEDPFHEGFETHVESAAARPRSIRTLQSPGEILDASPFAAHRSAISPEGHRARTPQWAPDLPWDGSSRSSSN